jgi:hypothetical protein
MANNIFSLNPVLNETDHQWKDFAGMLNRLPLKRQPVSLAYDNKKSYYLLSSNNITCH